MEELHDGVKLLLKRMESHPEEFVGVSGMDEHPYTISPSRWTSVIHQYWRYFTEHEQEAIKAGIRNANRSNFHAAVMETILVEPRRKESYPLYTQELQGISTQGSVTIAQPANTAVSAKQFFEDAKQKGFL